MIRDVDNIMGRVGASPHQMGRSHLTSSTPTRKGNTNGKTEQQSRKAPAPPRLPAAEEKRCQSREALEIGSHHKDTKNTKLR
jgi:hypothetical protein